MTTKHNFQVGRKRHNTKKKLRRVKNKTKSKKKIFKKTRKSMKGGMELPFYVASGAAELGVRGAAAGARGAAALGKGVYRKGKKMILEKKKQARLEAEREAERQAAENRLEIEKMRAELKAKENEIENVTRQLKKCQDQVKAEAEQEFTPVSAPNVPFAPWAADPFGAPLDPTTFVPAASEAPQPLESDKSASNSDDFAIFNKK